MIFESSSQELEFCEAMALEDCSCCNKESQTLCESKLHLALADCDKLLVNTKADRTVQNRFTEEIAIKYVY
jgi:hypothetical protein